MKLKNVLSLFDGISCGRLALNRAGIEYENYYASEIDKYAIAITRYNFPNTIFVGDIRNLKGEDFEDIDLIMGGSPCLNFSFSGKKQGMITKEKIEVVTLEQYLELKQQKFEFEGQSYLFWEFVRLLKEIKPKWFLLENVKMQKKWERVITKALEVEPIEINSALVSAQNRKRLYWTNILVKGLPEDKGILLKNILEDKVDNKYFLNKENISFMNGYWGKTTRWVKMKNSLNGKSQTICASFCKGLPRGVVILDYVLEQTLHKGSICSVHKEKSKVIRRLTPVECERLQTLPDNYTKYGIFEDGRIKQISDTQRYKTIGNAWTVDVIAWIFSFLKI